MDATTKAIEAAKERENSEKVLLETEAAGVKNETDAALPGNSERKKSIEERKKKNSIF